MASYAIPITTALIVFALIALVGTLPWTLYQYRKFGYFSFWRNFILFSFIFYCLTAFFLVSLPLPEHRNNIEFKNHLSTQLIPFNLLYKFSEVPGFKFSSLGTYPILFKSFTFLEVFFNLLLLAPLGIYLRFFFKTWKKWSLALLVIFSFTLFFEVSQLTGLFGFYRYPYRLFDVDDLIINTLGGMLGFFLAPLLLALIPSRHEINLKDQIYSENKIASYGSQLIEIVVSLFIARRMGTLVSFIGFKGHYEFILQLLVIFLFIVVMPFITDGNTLGGKLIKIQLILPTNRKFLGLFYRFIIIVFPSVLSQTNNYMNHHLSENIYLLSLQIFITLFSLLVVFLYTVLIIKDWIRKRSEVFLNRYSNIAFKRK